MSERSSHCGQLIAVLRGRGRPALFDWDAIDWTLTDSEIARGIGCSPASPAYHRKRLRKPNPNKGRHVGPRVRQIVAANPCWDTVDWSRRDIEIAAEIGLTRERVRQVRVQRGIPKSPNMRRHTRTLNRAKQITEPVTAKDVARRFKLKLRTAVDFLKKHCPDKMIPGDPPPKHYQFWPLVNWSLPNVDLRRIWFGSTDFALRVNMCRWRVQHYGGVKAKWDGRAKASNSPERMALIAAETARARAHFATHKYPTKRMRRHLRNLKRGMAA